METNGKYMSVIFSENGQKLALNEWKSVLYLSHRAVKLLFYAVICGYYG